MKTFLVIFVHFVSRWYGSLPFLLVLSFLLGSLIIEAEEWMTVAEENVKPKWMEKNVWTSIKC